MEDKLELQGIYSEGYGIVAKKVMKDKDLSITAKGIYSYLCSYCGGGTTCFPSRETICEDLGINKDTFTKHVKQLTEKKYVTINQIKSNKENKFCHNIYTINLITNVVDIKNPCPNFSDTVKSDSNNPCPNLPDTEISDTNNNNIYNKKEKEEKNLKNELVKIIDFYQNNITIITQYVAEDMQKYLESGLDTDLIIEVMKEAVSRNKRNWKYIATILNKCEDDNIRTANQFKISQEEFKSNKKQNNSQKKEQTKEEFEYKESELTEEEYFARLKGKKDV